jgi:hypothetical protein
MAIAMALVAFQVQGASQGVGGRTIDQRGISYTHGQAVYPAFHGWLENPDGTFDLHFGYFNANWVEEVHVPLGPDNIIQPAPFGPDGGQPTHFLPQVNRWQFVVRVPKDFGSKEVVWTVTSHGVTQRAYGTLNPAYHIDEFLIMFEFGNADGKSAATDRSRPLPTLEVEGAMQRTVKVGQPTPLIAVATAPGMKIQAPRRNDAAPPRRAAAPGGNVGNAGGARSAAGLRFAWYVYRGPGTHVTFDPPIPFKVWEDPRRGSPYSPGWQPPPIPPGNKWVHNITFDEPGTYVIRGQVHDGYHYVNRDVTFTVTP